jgi:hypothetical protein
MSLSLHPGYELNQGIRMGGYNPGLRINQNKVVERSGIGDDQSHRR